MRRTALCALLTALSFGCGNGANSVVANDASNDLAVQDIPQQPPQDLPPPQDTPPAPDAPDDVTDVADASDVTDATDALPPGICATNADCATSADGPVCDPASRRCVACTEADNRCAAGSYCETLTHRCLPGCSDDRACMAVASDAGTDGGPAPAYRCDTAARRCVECVTDAHCGAGSLCVANVCVPGCNDGHACPTGQTCCANACVDTRSSTASCGACNARCEPANAAPACRNGVCAVGMCLGSFGDCDNSTANGCETDTQTTVSHCGGCGMACATRPNSTVTCAAGRCAYACNTGFSDCDGDPSNGCEVDTRTSTSHCGACGRACTPPNGTAACMAGVCAIARCDTNFGDCDGNASNGCETDTRTSVSNCGACGTACVPRPNAVPVCALSRCALVCVSGFQDCDGDATNGCEVDIRTSATNCGGCGRACAVAGGEGRCVAGACSVATCAAGRADCDMSAANGCETDVAGNTANCGGCGVTCATRANAGTVCTSGACGFTCAANFGDCDMSATTGCETDTRTSTAHCGACGRACPTRANAASTCAAGTCGFTCNAGFADCDGDASNGCEVDTRTSLGNCGACGRACAPANATGVCIAGSCVVESCAANRANCDGNSANGCEVDLRTSAANCGTCGRACASGQSCYAALCSATCSDPTPIDFSVAGCTNVAPAGIASSQSNYTSGSTANFANDGNRCTGWNAGTYAPRWWMVDLRAVTDVRGVTLVPGMSPTTASVVHVLEASNDGSSWRTIRTVSQVMTSGQNYPIDFGTVQSLRYLRVTSTSSPSWISWVDVGVFRCP